MFRISDPCIDRHRQTDLQADGRHCRQTSKRETRRQLRLRKNTITRHKNLTFFHDANG